MPYELGQPVPIEVTYDSTSLFVAAKLFFWGSGSPVQVGGAIPMQNFSGFSYGCVITPSQLGAYTVNKAVYTDGTYTSLDPDESQGSDAFDIVPASVAPSTEFIFLSPVVVMELEQSQLVVAEVSQPQETAAIVIPPDAQEII